MSSDSLTDTSSENDFDNNNSQDLISFKQNDNGDFVKVYSDRTEYYSAELETTIINHEDGAVEEKYHGGEVMNGWEKFTLFILTAVFVNEVLRYTFFY
jgi:hypothetical protein